MELVQTDQFPRRIERLVRIGVIGDLRSHGRQELRVVQQELALAVVTFGAGLAGQRAAMQFQVELTVPDRQILRLGLDTLEELPHRARPHARTARHVGHQGGVVQHLAGRPAAAIAMAVGRYEFAVCLLLVEVAPGAQHLLRRHHAVVGRAVRQMADFVRRGHEVGQHPCAVDALPPEQLVGQAVILVPADLRRDEPVQAGLSDQLRQRAGEAERVGQPHHRRLGLAEFVAKILPAEQELARQRFRARCVAIGLDPGAAHHLPAPVLYALFDAVEDLRIILFGVFVELGLALGEDVVGVVVHHAQHVAERSAAFAARLRQRPQPGHVDMGMTNPDDIDIDRRACIGDTQL